MPAIPTIPAATGSLLPVLDASGIVGHQGGWDEAALVLGPLAIIALLLWLANRRVKDKLEEARGLATTEAGDGPADASGGPNA